MRPHYCLSVLFACLLVEQLLALDVNVTEPAKPEKYELQRTFINPLRIACFVVSVLSALCGCLAYSCKGESEDTRQPNPQNSHEALYAIRIYENDE